MGKIYFLNKNTMSYDGRIDLLPRVGCYVEGQGTLSVVKDDHVCIKDVYILDDYVDHLRVRVKNHFKGKGDVVKFKAKVSMYAKERKVGLDNFSFL